MSGKRQVKIEILGDARGIRQAFGDAGSAAGGLISKLGSVASIAGGFVVGQALTALPGMLSGAADMAVRLEQNARKAATVFGDSLGTVQSWADEAAAGMGLTNNEAVALAASMGDLLVPLGFSREAAADMSTQMLDLSGALSEWSGGQKSAAEVSDILTAAMLGEYDQLKSLGISLDANEVKQRAATLTGEEFANMTDQQKEAIAAQQLILEKSTDAQTAYATSQDDLASRQARLTAQWKTAKEQLASALIPAIQAVLGAVLPLATALFTQLGPALAEVSAFVGQVVAAFQAGGLSGALDLVVQQVQAFAPVLLATLSSWASAFIDWIGPLIPPMLERLGQLLVQIGDWLVNTGVPWLAERLGQWADAFGAWAQAAVPPMLERLSELLAQLGTWMADVALPALFEKLGQWGQAFIDWIGPRIVPMLEALWQLYYAIESWMLTEALPAIAAKLAEWGAQFVAWVGPQIGPLLSELGNLLAQLGSWLIDTALPEIGAKLLEWGLAFVKWVAPQIPPLLAELGTLLVQLGDWIITTALPEITTKLLEWAAAFLDWIATSVLPYLAEKLGEILTKVGSWIISDGVPGMISAGEDLGEAVLDGIAAGIDAAWETLTGALDSVISKVTGAINDAIDIVNRGINAINGALEFSINVPGVDMPGPIPDIPSTTITVDPPDIPTIPHVGSGNELANYTGGAPGTSNVNNYGGNPATSMGGQLPNAGPYVPGQPPPLTPAEQSAALAAALNQFYGGDPGSFHSPFGMPLAPGVGKGGYTGGYPFTGGTEPGDYTARLVEEIKRAIRDGVREALTGAL